MTERAKALVDGLKLLASEHNANVETVLHDSESNYWPVHVRVKPDGTVSLVTYPDVTRMLGRKDLPKMSQMAVDVEILSDEQLRSSKYLLEDEVPEKSTD